MASKKETPLPPTDPEELRAAIVAVGQKRQRVIKKYQESLPSHDELIPLAAYALAQGWSITALALSMRMNRTQFYRDILPGAEAMKAEAERRILIMQDVEPIPRRA